MDTLTEWQRYQATRPDVNSEEFRAKLLEAFTPDFEMVEPPSTPFGGTWTGPADYLTMRGIMVEHWICSLEDHHIWESSKDDVIIKYSMMSFTSRQTGRSVDFPSVQVVRFRDGKMSRVEVFYQDSGSLLATLDDVPATAPAERRASHRG